MSGSRGAGMSWSLTVGVPGSGVNRACSRPPGWGCSSWSPLGLTAPACLLLVGVFPGLCWFFPKLLQPPQGSDEESYSGTPGRADCNLVCHPKGVPSCAVSGVRQHAGLPWMAYFVSHKYLSSIPGTHEQMEGENQFHKAVFTPIHVCHAYMPPRTYHKNYK